MEIDGIGAIVTGGGSDLGEATARALADRGASVAIAVREVVCAPGGPAKAVAPALHT